MTSMEREDLRDQYFMDAIREARGEALEDLRADAAGEVDDDTEPVTLDLHDHLQAAERDIRNAGRCESNRDCRLNILAAIRQLEISLAKIGGAR